MNLFKKTSFAFVVLSCLAFSAQPAAAACDTGTELEMLRCELNQLLSAMQRGQQLVNTTRIQDTVDSAVTFAKNALPSQAAVDDFGPRCSGFRTFLSDLVMLMNDTTNSILAFNSMPNPLFVVDPGLAALIQGIPCDFLQPVWVVADALGLLDGSVVSLLEEVPNALDTLRPIAFPAGAAPARSTSAGLDDPRIAAVCSDIKTRDDLVFAAHTTLNGAAYSFASLGALFKALGKTGLTAVKEAHVAAWGWAGGTIEHNNLATAGTIFSGIGDVLIGAGGAVSRKRVYCALREDHLVLAEEYEALKDGQTEIIRLLLTPQGRRSTEFCHEPGCDPLDFPE